MCFFFLRVTVDFWIFPPLAQKGEFPYFLVTWQSGIKDRNIIFSSVDANSQSLQTLGADFLA